MRRYTIEVVIDEGSDDFWESLSDKSGCDEILEAVKDALSDAGFQQGQDTTIRLVRFEVL